MEGRLWDLSICGFWNPWWVLELIPCGYPGMTVVRCKWGTGVLRSCHLTLWPPVASRQQRPWPFILVHFTNIIFYASYVGKKVGKQCSGCPESQIFKKQTSRDRACGFRTGVMRTPSVLINVRCLAQGKERSGLSSPNRKAGDFLWAELLGCWPLGLSQEGWGPETNEPGQSDQDRRGNYTDSIFCRPWGY